MKSKSTAGIFALFLGGLGVHRFYLGQIGLGFAYLIFCWTFIPAIIALIDGIIFLTQSEEAFNAKYNKNYLMPIPYGMMTQGLSIEEKLEKLGNLREKGLLTEDEFNTQKRQLLGF